MSNFDAIEKQIDWITRELRDEVKFSNGDINLKNEIIKLADAISLYDTDRNYGVVNPDDSETSCDYIVNYFIQSLKREFNSPEVIQRVGKSSDYTW